MGQHLLVLGQRGRVAVDRRGPGVDHAAHAGLLCRHQDIERGIDTVAVGGHRIGDRPRHRRQSGLVKDDLDPGAGFGADGRVREVAFEELHGLKANQIRAFAGNEAIDATYRFAASQ